MKLAGRNVLTVFKQKHADVRSQVDEWEQEAKEAAWSTPQDIKRRYSSASFLSGNRVVFNLKGTKYRLRVKVSYQNQVVFIEKAGTHQEYMKWST